MSEREQILDQISILMREVYILRKINAINDRAIISAGHAVSYHMNELNMLDLVEFCNTGRFPA